MNLEQQNYWKRLKKAVGITEIIISVIVGFVDVAVVDASATLLNHSSF